MLPAKQEAFCQQYIICKFNGTQAAKEAGYSPKTANEKAAQLLAMPAVKARIAELQSEIAERNKLKEDDVIQELRALGFYSIKDFIEEGNVIKDLTKLDREMLKPVVGIKITEKMDSEGYPMFITESSRRITGRKPLRLKSQGNELRSMQILRPASV
jgi:phage terminase small subunit